MMKTIFLFISILTSTNAFSCGTTAQHFMSYWILPNKESKSEFLQMPGCSPDMNYEPLVADVVITTVLADAINIDVKPGLISKVIKNHNCLFAARKIPEYASIEKFISTNSLSRFCSAERLEASYVIFAKGGVNLRSSPSKNGEKIRTIAEGVLVELISKSGDWALIKSYAGEGYIFYPLLKAIKDA